MRQTISGLVAAFAVMAASAVPAMACGGGCSPCGQTYVSPCAQPQVYVAPEPVYSGCNTGCGGWAHERLPDPVQQYYYVDQGPTYTGPGNFAPYRTYQEGSYHRPYHHGYRTHRWHHTGYGYGARHGYATHYGYAPRFYGPRHSMRYGAPHHYGEHVLRRYY